mgnify:CR=1 FL=1
MNIIVCEKGKVAKLTSVHNATHVISLLDPGDRPFLHPNHKVIWRSFPCEDQLNENEPNAPTRELVKNLLDFFDELNENSVVIVHCHAGVSRSTAAALALLVKKTNDIELSIETLKQIRPIACPNPVISKFADELLGCDGKLFEASEKLANEKIIRMCE